MYRSGRKKSSSKKPIAGLFILLIFLTIPSFATDNDTLTLSEKSSIYSLSPYLKVFYHPDTLEGTNAWKVIQDGKMERSEETINPGMNHANDSYWLVFTLASKISGDYYLEIDYPQIDKIQLYKVKESVHSLFKTGDQYEFSQRPVKARNFILPIELDSEVPTTFLLNIDKRKSAVRFPIQVYHQDVFLTKQFNENLFYSFYFGFILLVILASLLLGILVKKRVFIAYSLYLAAFWLWLFSRLGYTYQFLTFNFPEINRHFLPVCTQLAIMTLIFYVQTFFDTKSYLRKFHRVMNGVLVFFSFGYVVWAIFPDWFISVAPQLFILRYSLTALVIAFAITAAIRYRQTDPFRSNMFLLAYTLFFGAIFSKMFAEFGIVTESLLRIDPIFLGFFIEVLFLTITMGVILKRMLTNSTKLEAENEELLEAIEIHSAKEKMQTTGYITLKSKAVIPVGQLMYIKADDHYLEFYFEGDRPREIDRNTLSKISKELPQQFARIHRSTIINLDYVKATYSNKIILKDETELPLSRKYKQDLIEILAK